MSDDDDRDDYNDDELDDDDDLEPVDFDDEDDYEDEKGPKKKKKKTSAPGGSAKSMSIRDFLDTEADVDEDADEEEYDEEGDEDGFITREAAEAEAIAAQQNRRNRMSLFDQQEKSVEEITKEIEERHRNYSLDDDMDDEDAPAELRRTGMLPSVRDPKLWMIKCKPGKEKATVVALMRKCLMKNTGEDKILIKSAIAPTHLKGYIYIEADKDSHVKAAIKGLRTLDQYNLKLVPIKEMVDVLTVTKKAVNLKRNEWVRIKRGLYKGDLGQIYETDETRGRVTVKLIPRLDLANLDKPDDAGKRAKKTRMPARFFNPDEVASTLGGRAEIERRVDPYTGDAIYILAGNRFVNGYLLKPMDSKSIDTNDVLPSLEELQKFQEKPVNEGEEADDLASLAGSLQQHRKVTYKKGDTVIIVEGDLKHLMGTVESVDNDTVTIMPKHEDLHDLLSLPQHQLKKYFKKGDHVKVISGRFEGETGLIINVEENSVVIFSDLTNQEIKVFSQDIQECSEVATGRIKLGAYELHDLVQINPQTVGVIVKIERDQFRIIDNNGNVQTVSLAAIGAKKNSPRDATSFDANQNPVSVGDIAKVIDGPHRNRQGTVKHIFRAFAFLHSREVLDNSGVFVTRTGHLSVLGGKAKTGDGFGAFPSASPRFPPSSPGPRGLRSPARNVPGSPSQFGGNVPIRRKIDNSLKEKTVTILRGNWKGYIGIVKDATETTVRVELHTNGKKVTVPRESVKPKDEAGVETSGYHHDTAYPPQTPVWGSRTPMREDPTATPLRTPGTPMRTPGTPSRTPGTPIHGTAWDPNMPNTPMRTATPSWDPDYGSSNWTPGTPGGGYSGFTPFSPARSAYDGTPAESSHTPVTPSAYTPASTYDQRTPSNDATPYSTSYQPTTPLTPASAGPTTPRGPVTPSSDYMETSTPAFRSERTSQWHLPGVEVNIVGDPNIRNQSAVIQETWVENGTSMCKVQLASTHQTVLVQSDALERIIPDKKAMTVIVIDGEHKGQTGVLIGIDNADGIVKMDSNLDIKILDLQTLAKYQKRV